MRRTFFVILALSLTVTVAAQEKTYPLPEKMTPGMTEFWTPQPKIVTPGDILTNSAPSDAIVLFDGKNLDAWQSAEGGEAKWTVHDGVFTVNKPSGDIITKESFGSFQLHLEWCVPENITGTSQGRGTRSRSWTTTTTRPTPTVRPGAFTSRLSPLPTLCASPESGMSMTSSTPPLFSMRTEPTG